MKKNILILVVLNICLLASAENLLACSCQFSADPLKKQIQTAFTNSSAIFAGEVIAISESAGNKNDFSVKFKVAQVWKGENVREVTITTNKESSMCGYGFEVGKKYLVYANGSKSELSVNNCSRTAYLSNKGDVKYLKKFKSKKFV